jgi:hypothetical protein
LLRITHAVDMHLCTGIRDAKWYSSCNNTDD